MGADLNYTPVAHVSGTAAVQLDLTQQIPWLYIIVAVRQRIIYIGETHDQGGLVVRLSSHFGYYQQSGLKQAAAKHAGIKRLTPPFLVFGARLPFSDDTVTFEGTSKQIRLRMEATVHELVTSRFVASRGGWVVVSSASPVGIKLSRDMEQACDGILRCFVKTASLE